MIDFHNFNAPKSPNYYLLAPENYAIKGTALSPVYDFSITKLMQRWHIAINTLPRLTLLHQDDSRHYYEYKQVSKVFRFPDFIDCELISLPHNKSTLILYSRAKYGYSD